MKRISKCLSWNRVYWQVPGSALGGWGRLHLEEVVPAKEMGRDRVAITAGADRQGGARGPRRQTCGVLGKMGETTLHPGSQRGGKAS